MSTTMAKIGSSAEASPPPFVVSDPPMSNTLLAVVE
jgi:hypothetical protein